MSQSLKYSNVISVGLTLFAFFLGAGNIIFPPLAGFESGTNVGYSMTGFLLTGVGLPLISVIAIALAGGTLKGMTTPLPKGTGTIAMIVLFIVIGPAFATPRTSLVAWDLAIKPLAETFKNTIHLNKLATTSIFFGIVTLFSIFRGKLISNIGKILTPVLFSLLLILAIGVISNPWSEILPPTKKAYIYYPLAQGFLEGYKTMDALGALMFGQLLVDILKSKGITERKVICQYLIRAGIIAAIGLSFVYISLFWLGATAAQGSIVGGISSTNILSSYIAHLFGPTGIYILSTVVFLACLTTAVGLISACADYFSELFKSLKIPYQVWVILFAITSGFVANVELDVLNSAAIPALYALYPLVITIVLLTFLKGYMNHQIFFYRLVMSVTLVMGLLAALKKYFLFINPIKHNMSSLLFLPVSLWQELIGCLRGLPLYQQDLEWIFPVIFSFIIAFIIDSMLKKAKS